MFVYVQHFTVCSTECRACLDTMAMQAVTVDWVVNSSGLGFILTLLGFQLYLFQCGLKLLIISVKCMPLVFPIDLCCSEFGHLGSVAVLVTCRVLEISTNSEFFPSLLLSTHISSLKDRIWSNRSFGKGLEL